MQPWYPNQNGSADTFRDFSKDNWYKKDALQRQLPDRYENTKYPTKTKITCIF